MKNIGTSGISGRSSSTGRSNWEQDVFRRFVVQAPSAYEAARKFDTSEDNNTWTRVSGATLYDEV